MTTKPAKKKKPISFLQGVREIAHEYDYFILDLWGVVHNGFRPFDGVTDCFIRLKRQGKHICLLSNSPSRASQAAEALNVMGISKDMYSLLLTSGETVNMLFRQKSSIFDDYKTSKYYDLWPESHGTTLDNLSLLQTKNIVDAGFIIAAFLDTDNRNEIHFYEEELIKAAKIDLPMICANPDQKVHHGEELQLCPGSVAKRYEELGGKVHWVGKPYSLVYEYLHELMGRPDKKRIVAVGDSLNTDIHGASDFGIDSVLNLTGLHREEVLDQNNNPDHKKVNELIESREYKPTYTMAGFKW